MFIRSKSKKRQLRHEKLRADILNYYASFPKGALTAERAAVFEHVKKNGLHVFPFPFVEKYKPKDIHIACDKCERLDYMMLDHKRLYCGRTGEAENAQLYFNTLLCEQDPDSPHRYLTSEFDVRENDIVVDVGAAEGMFALSVVEKAKELYLFETNHKWIKALHATFKPWKNKVHIIRKFVCDKNGWNRVSLDSYFKDKGRINFIKMDVEGAEHSVLKGAQKIIAGQKDIKIALTAYHRQDDEKLLSEWLTKNGFSISYAKGYMIFIIDKNIDKPYLRRGVIRAVKI